MKPDTTERDLVFKLLQGNSTLGQVAQHLKRKGLHYSAGSWDEMFGKRVGKALEEKELTREDLVDLIRMTEEYGTQHVFLYSTSRERASARMDRERGGSSLQKMGLSSLVKRPRILAQPSSPTITDERFDFDPQNHTFIATVLPRRSYQRFIPHPT